MMQDDTFSSTEAFEVLDAESLPEDTRKAMLASEEKTFKAYLECRLSELRQRKGRIERAVTKQHAMMIEGLMKDVDDFKNRVQYDHRIGDFRQYILEQCARFEWDLQESKHELQGKLRDLQESKHQLLDKVRGNRNETKKRKVASQNVATTDPHEEKSDPLVANVYPCKANDDPYEANVDPHEAHTDTDKANVDPRKANADTHEASTNPHEENTKPHEGNINRHETKYERHQKEAQRHETNAEQFQTSAEQQKAQAEQHKTTANAHEATAELHEEKAGPHMSNVELHKTNAGRHKTSAETDEAIAVAHQTIAELHEAIPGTHQENAELHEDRAEQHKINADPHEEKAGRHMSNTELHKTNAARHKTTAEPAEAIAVAHETIAELHEAIPGTHQENAELHDGRAEKHKTNGHPHETNANQRVGNGEHQKANDERLKANDERYVVSDDQHKAKTRPHKANANPHRANANRNEAIAGPHAANFDTHEENTIPNEADARRNEAQATTQVTNVASTRDQEINKRPCFACGVISMKSPEAGEYVQELHITSKASKSNPIGNNREFQPSNGNQPKAAARGASKAKQDLAATNLQVTQEKRTRTQGVNHEVDVTWNQATITKDVAPRIEATNLIQLEDSSITNRHQTSKMTLDSPTSKGSTTEGIKMSKCRSEGKADTNATIVSDGYFHTDNKDPPAKADRSSIDLLLIGNCGNGKSATGNSILGKPTFRRNASSSVDCESSATTIMMDSTDVDGKVVNVIDGPSLNVFGKITPEELEKTINNLHRSLELCEFAFTAVLITLKFGNRFTKQEVDAIRVIKNVLGKDVIRDYGVCVITFGDAFDHHVEEAREDGEEVTFEGWLHSQTGEVVTLLEECGFRCVLFDNVTKDGNKRLAQVKKLLEVLPQGKRFSQEAFLQALEGTHGLELEANLPDFLREVQKEADGIAEMMCHYEETKKYDPEVPKIKSKLSELKEKVYSVRAKSSELDRLKLFVLQLETELNMKINKRRIEREMYMNDGGQYAHSETALRANKTRKDVGKAPNESRVGGLYENLPGTVVFANSGIYNNWGCYKESHPFSSTSLMYGERETTTRYKDNHYDSYMDASGFEMVREEMIPETRHESLYDIIKRRVTEFFLGIVASTPTHQSANHGLVFHTRQI